MERYQVRKIHTGDKAPLIYKWAVADMQEKKAVAYTVTKHEAEAYALQMNVNGFIDPL